MAHACILGESERSQWPTLLGYLRHQLERVSVKRVRIGSLPESRPLSQQQLIDFVRNAPNLRWFKSDLSDENLVLLKMERPEVIFVSVVMGGTLAC